MSRLFFVEPLPRRWKRWRVRVRWAYGSHWVADFWTYAGALAVVDRLNRSANEFGWARWPGDAPSDPAAYHAAGEADGS